MKKDNQIRDIAIIMNLAGAACRDILTGISTYARERGRWRLKIFSRSEDFAAENLEEVRSFDGIITSESDAPGVSALLETSHLPAIIIGLKGECALHKRARTIFVRNDDGDIGCLAARHLLSLGRFRSFGFVSDVNNGYWSHLRKRGFQAYLKKQNITVLSPANAISLREWLESLSKPAAVMAAFDERAIDVLSACKSAKIRVPEQVAVMGVDNDELFCDFSSPPLTSILPNHHQEGRLAAEELARLLRHDLSHEGETILCKGKKIVSRESTAPISPASHLVNEALRFIRRNCRTGLRTEDVVRHLGVSRRLIDLRLREANEPSLAASISQCRLNEVARQLRETKLSIQQIAAACTYPNVQHLANVFKRTFGESMTVYRHRHPR